MECPKCRYVSLPGSHFCEKCGYDLKALRRQQPRNVPGASSYGGGYAGGRGDRPSAESGGYRPGPAPTPAPAPSPAQAAPPPPRQAPPARQPAPVQPPPPRPRSNPVPVQAAQPRTPAPAPTPPPPPPQPAYGEIEDLVSGKRFELRYDRSLVGRQSAADSIFPEVDLEALARDGSVSRKHALILRDGASVVVEDCGSSNGTFVHQTKVEAGLQHELQDGDEIRFGTVRFRFRRRG